MRTNPRAASSIAGASLVEFVLALPILMMLFVGVIEYGRLTYFGIEVSNAAHAGAQFGSLSSANAANHTAVANAVTADGQNSISSLSVTVTNPCTCWNGTTANPSTPTVAACAPCSGGGWEVSYVEVQVTGIIHPLFNYSMLGLPSQWTVTRTAYSQVAQ